ncbi:NAD(P)-dependent oxidoreductase [Actinomadura sp. 21ATH]|uniref:NAD(P)-dependent oxidoreductase n=1 Tax=Actinomadura sp. 21ATH TaxID=1735444 RepID=UPI0035BF5CB5
MDTISVLGLGAMGTALARTFLDHGHPVVVWNRTPGKDGDLVERGATRAATPAEALAAGALGVLCVSDYTAAEAILDGTAPDRPLVNLTTGTPDQARRVAAGRAGYLDGVVQASPAQIGGPDATLLIGGPRAVYERHRKALDLLGTFHFVGEDPGQACLYDLTMHGLWYDAMLAYLRALAFVDDPEAFAPFAARQFGYVAQSAGDTAREVTSRDYPRGPASLAEHAPVLEHLISVGAERFREMHALVERRIAQGHGTDGLTSVIEELRRG